MPWSRALRRGTGCYEMCPESFYITHFAPYSPKTQQSHSSFDSIYMAPGQLTAKTWQLSLIWMSTHPQPLEKTGFYEMMASSSHGGIVYHAIPVKHKYVRQSPHFPLGQSWLQRNKNASPPHVAEPPAP